MKRSILPGMRISAFIGLPSETRASCSAMVKPRLGNERERMRRIDRQRRQQRKDVAQEMILDPAPLGLGDIAAVDQHDAVLGQHRRADRARSPAGRWPSFETASLMQHQLLGRRQAVGAALGDALAHLRLDAGDADHEEFIKVVGRNRQEPHPLQQRDGRGLTASSSTRRLKCSQDSSRLMKRSGLAAIIAAGSISPFFSLITIACAKSHQIINPAEGRRAGIRGNRGPWLIC